MDVARAGGLAKWRIGCPRGTAVDRFGQIRKDAESAADQRAVGLGKFFWRQVMVARTFIPKGAIDQHEIVGGWPSGHDKMTGRGHADQKVAAGDEELLAEQHRKRGADRAADNAETLGAVVELIEIGVVARPAWRTPRLPGLARRARGISPFRSLIRDFGIRGRQPLQAPRLAQQVCPAQKPMPQQNPSQAGSAPRRRGFRRSCFPS